ncbi:transposase [Wolbachia endosymbiont of Leptopilina clavipes]|uniref:transposase n=1 Tax=Wolbachia endosymbiont of Leptopilina clavipes TaxID=260213 RepID=UPI00142DF589|nr:transposase [Wolbachia endosymbiont of Leptopilina clavipes]
MKYYSGLDISLKETFISIVDEKGKIVKEEVVASESSAIAEFLLSQSREYESIKVQEAIKDLDKVSKDSIEALVCSLEIIEESIKKLDKILSEKGKKDEVCKLLTTVPGVGIIVAMTYKATIDNPHRFETSDTVGAYMGLTPRQYASGEVNRHGSISKMGPVECRNMLYEAAHTILTVSKKKFKLKSWGIKLAKKKGIKKAVVALARKLAVIMHRMLVDKTEFYYQ